MKRSLLLALVLVMAVAAGVRQHVVDDVDLFAVQTGSMGTAAPIGSLVVVDPDEEPEVGDIVTYDLQNGELITHRVVEIDEDGMLRTQGDANDLPDPWQVDGRHVRGVVEDVVEQGGYLLRYVTLPAGAASVVSAAVTLLVAWRLFFPKVPAPA